MTEQPPLPWSQATATGVGSMPGTSAVESARVVAGELPGFLHLSELPVRGPGADAIGRTLALLHDVTADLGGDTTPTGWRLTGGETRLMRRARSWLGEDLDALEEVAQGYAGPLKLQVIGPWTLAAGVELPSGERMLRDFGAYRDLAVALAEAVRLHVAEARRRFPRASLALQLDEPGLPAVLGGRVGTASGLATYRAVDAATATAALRSVLDAAREAGALAGVHCCAQLAPVRLVHTAGADFVSVDLLLAQDDDALGEAWESGAGMLLGTVATTGEGRIADALAANPAQSLASRLGISAPDRLAQVVITPSCGLAAASPTWMRAALAACSAAARIMRDDEADERER